MTQKSIVPFMNLSAALKDGNTTRWIDLVNKHVTLDSWVDLCEVLYPSNVDMTAAEMRMATTPFWLLHPSYLKCFHSAKSWREAIRMPDLPWQSMAQFAANHILQCTTESYYAMLQDILKTIAVKRLPVSILVPLCLSWNHPIAVFVAQHCCKTNTDRAYLLLACFGMKMCDGVFPQKIEIDVWRSCSDKDVLCAFNLLSDETKKRIIARLNCLLTVDWYVVDIVHTALMAKPT
jgi:hypothetical protein